MKRSGFLLKITKIALDALFKATNADIRIHGEENIPDQPIVYVINHFTRMETFFLPYMIKKITGKDVLSLAFEGLFGGGLGKFLGKLGAVSTNAPDRDKIMIGALLKGEMPCMIFPEGQMVKDKKMVEKGKYMVYNSGIRRPPHTGAAVLALRAEFYREKLRFFREQKYSEGINSIINYFNIESDMNINAGINKILDQETCILPVNISYFPIRVRENAINKIAGMIVDNVSERVNEELSVEGAMMIDGVDIDINFDKPIPIKPFLNRRSIVNKIKDNSLYLEANEVRENLRFRKEGLQLMNRYMNSIYNMTTVNHDHIFAFILTKYKKKRIDEVDFRNRAYLAINKIQKMRLNYYHSTLKLNQDTILTDDKYEKYKSFIDVAKSSGLVSIDDGCIIINREKFSRIYEFHKIRKDNIIEVLKNEIEPVGYLVKYLNGLMRVPAFYIRRRVRDRFLELDNEIFNNDYEKYYIKNESKSREIGQPFYMKKLFGRRGVLLVHGYMAAPAEMRGLADFLFRCGYNVYGVRLRGHGTSPDDLALREWEEWYESVDRGYVVLRNSVKKVAIVGFSTGAGLALYQAINKKKRISCVISINAPLRLNNIASNLASAVVLWNDFLKKIHIKKRKMEFVSNKPENPSINYFRNPVSGVKELGKAMNIVEKELKDINVPTFIIQGSDDPVVNPDSGLEIFNKVGIENKELARIYSKRHVIVRGAEAQRVYLRIKGFLDESF